MSVYQIQRALAPDLKVHAIGKSFNGKLHGNASMALQYALAAGLEQVLQEPGEEHLRGSLERRLLNFIARGGIVVYVKDNDTVVGVATVGCCSGLWSESFLVEDLRVAKRTTVMSDRVYAALLDGILDVARITSKEVKKGPVLIHVGAATSERRLLRRTFKQYGFHQETAAQPDMWTAKVGGQEQLAVA